VGWIQSSCRQLISRKLLQSEVHALITTVERILPTTHGNIIFRKTYIYFYIQKSSLFIWHKLKTNNKNHYTRLFCFIMCRATRIRTCGLEFASKVLIVWRRKRVQNWHARYTFTKTTKIRPILWNPSRLDPPGTDVMVTIFCDFRQFSAGKNWRFSQKPMLWSIFSII
jgi:hypothetical protein